MCRQVRQNARITGLPRTMITKTLNVATAMPPKTVSQANRRLPSGIGIQHHATCLTPSCAPPTDVDPVGHKEDENGAKSTLAWGGLRDV